MMRIQCPKCGSLNWRCWDERNEWFEDKDGELFQYPVGYLACVDCTNSWIDTGEPEDGTKYIGNDREAFGRDY